MYNYDYILKMETFDRDSGSLLRAVQYLFLQLIIFSRESDSRIANVRPSVCPSIRLSVTETPQPLRIAPIGRQAY